MTIAALGLGLVRRTLEHFEHGPAALRAAATTVRAERRNVTADRFEAWAGELDGVKTWESTLRIGDSSPPMVPAVTLHLVSDDFAPDVAPQVGAAQRARAVMAVVHIVEAINTSRAAGADAVDPLEGLLGATQAVLHGWRPYPRIRGADALALQRGRLLGPPADGRALWQDEYLFQWTAPVHREVQDAFNGA